MFGLQKGRLKVPINYWSKEENPVTGEKLQEFIRYMRAWSNSGCDVDALIASEYGQKLGQLQHLAYQWEDPMDPGMLEWYRSYGVKKEMFETETFYSRWTLLSPLEMEAGKKYPLIFVNHGGGNYLESEEFSTGFNVLVGREKFLAAYLQNTNTDNILRILDQLCEKYPVDTERVYVAGFSQGGGKTTDCAFRAPERFAAHAPCGNDIYRYVDRWSIPYSEQEHENLKKAFLPFMQVVGCNEHSNIVPLNNWIPAERRKERIEGDLHTYPSRDGEIDPTRPSDPNHPGGQIRPPEGCDTRKWMVEQLNKRLALLDIEPRDEARCIRFETDTVDELHHIMGFYGDREEIQYHYGYKHYVVDIFNRSGFHAFRYVAVENSPHWPPVMMGRLVWDFFKQFRRDSLTGKIVADLYQQ